MARADAGFQPTHAGATWRKPARGAASADGTVSVDVEQFRARGSLLLICPDCGNWSEFPPIVGMVNVQLKHQDECALSDVRAVAEGRMAVSG